MSRVEVKIEPMAETIVLLHGFAGTGRTWDEVVARLDGQRYRSLAPDLPGHGAAVAVSPITFEDCVAHVLDAAPARFTLAGYSMGGRIALHVALAAPDRVDRLVLVSTTAGIEDLSAREQRRRADEALAGWAQAVSIAEFAQRWMEQPLFVDDPPDLRPAWRADLEHNEPGALACVLRGVGTGAMEPLWDRLADLAMPVDVVAGERDAKFRELGERLAARLPHSRLTIVPAAGHALPREAPAAVAAIISSGGPGGPA